MNAIAKRAKLAELKGELSSQWALWRAYCWRHDKLSQEAAAAALGRSLALQDQIRRLEEEQPGPGGLPR